MDKNKSEQELIRCKEMIEDLSIEVANLLEAMLFFAGVKRENLQKAVQEYIDAIDVVFKDEDGEMGLDEIIKVIKYLKSNKSELF